ncbi:LPS assembly lipoprotein LptE [Marinobacter sp. ANT_B65]|uniref:LPS-assembly lipoprotein LptE n=1 Tax=Marinobacter sp. ANT_B65 TaxID=2039467 RepID=UPI000BBEC331|nr:LPS assembly lipoprotein LptE [Marinobacter sp. ANT_B65]PCM45174.1 hypothetical protein CPA50_03935 [Marinobacter sp. ANT_B65]
MRPGTLYLNAARLIALGTMAASLTACGFQLRSAPQVSSALEPLALDCQPPVPTSLCLSVREQLELNGIQLTSEDDAKYHLRIRNFEEDRRVSAITSEAAAAEYTLRHSVSLELISTDGIPVIASTPLTSVESYLYDDTSVLAKQREEDGVKQQLDDRLAQQIIFRLTPVSPERLQEIRANHEKTNAPANTSTDAL